MELFKFANLALRFGLELCMLAALGYWGWSTGQSAVGRVGLSIGASLIGAVVWGMFLSPRAAVPIGEHAQLLLEALVWGCAVAALVAVGSSRLAWVLVLLVIINKILLYLWRP
jgi:hypothetical protein